MRARLAPLGIALIATVGLEGCAAGALAPVNGILYTNVSAPLTATGNVNATKVGTGSCQSILGLFASGDCSIAAAAKQAGITRIHHVDYKTTGVLTLFAKYTVVVYGE